MIVRCSACIAMRVVVLCTVYMQTTSWRFDWTYCCMQWWRHRNLGTRTDYVVSCCVVGCRRAYVRAWQVEGYCVSPARQAVSGHDLQPSYLQVTTATVTSGQVLWRIGCITAAQGRFSRIRQVAPMGTPFNTYDPPESRTQTVYRSVQRFLQGSRSWQTDRRTDHCTPSVTIGRIYVCITAMRPIITTATVVLYVVRVW